MKLLPFKLQTTLTTASTIIVNIALVFSAVVAVGPSTRPEIVKAQESSSAQTAVGGSLEEELTQVQKKLGELAKQKQDIQNAINAESSKQGGYSSEIRKIQNERALLQSEIDEKELIIQELNLQIEILNITIADTEVVVAETEESITELEIETDKQLSDMYLDLKTASNSLSMIFADGSSSIVKAGLYQQTIQEDTNSSLLNLKVQSDKLKNDKAKLELDKETVETDKARIDEEKAELDIKRSEIQTKLNRLNQLYAESMRSLESNRNAMESLSDQEAKLFAEQELIQQRLFNQTGSISNGQYVVKGTIIGYQGLTGLTTGYHLHFGVQVNGSYQNPCSYLPTGRFGNCGGNGQLSWPLQGTFYYTSGYGPRNLGGGTSSFHAAIDIAHPVQNAPIYAAHDGWYIRGFEPCSGGLCKNGGANYVILCQNKNNCNSGFKTMYWHLK